MSEGDPSKLPAVDVPGVNGWGGDAPALEAASVEGAADAAAGWRADCAAGCACRADRDIACNARSTVLKASLADYTPPYCSNASNQNLRSVVLQYRFHWQNQSYDTKLGLSGIRD